MEEPTTSVYLGNLSPSVTRRHLYEIGIQAGPVVSVSLPQDTTVSKGAVNKGFGFVEYQDVEDAKYAVALFRGNLRLFGREVRVQFGGQPKRSGSGVGLGTQQQQQQGRSGGTPQGEAEERRQQSVARTDLDRQAQHVQQPPLPPQQHYTQQHHQPQTMHQQPQLQHGYVQPQPPMPQSFTFAGMMQAAQQQHHHHQMLQQQLHLQQQAAAYGMTPSPIQQQQQQAQQHYGSSPHPANGEQQQYESSPYGQHQPAQPPQPYW